MDKSDQFSQGLVPVLQMVATATSSMYEADNDFVNGQASDKKLEAVALHVGGQLTNSLSLSKVHGQL